jgi:hypothetical protein
MPSTHPLPLRPVTDDEVTVFVQRPSFVDEEAVTTVSMQRVRAVPPPIRVTTGDEPTRIIDGPVRRDATMVSARAGVFDDTRRTNRPVRSALRIPIAVAAIVAAALVGGMWKRAHSTPRQETAKALAAPKPPPAPSTPAATTSAPAPTTRSTTAAVAADTGTDASSPFDPTADERAAVEAVESGAYAQAAALYRSLSIRHPNNEAYRTAARILEQRTKETAR